MDALRDRWVVGVFSDLNRQVRTWLDSICGGLT